MLTYISFCYKFIFKHKNGALPFEVTVVGVPRAEAAKIAFDSYDNEMRARVTPHNLDNIITEETNNVVVATPTMLELVDTIKE